MEVVAAEKFLPFIVIEIEALLRPETGAVLDRTGKAAAQAYKYP